jgi:ferrous iron transport protein B
MELPAYKRPDAKNVILNLWLRAKVFLTRAGTIILSMMVLIWFLSTFPAPPPGAPGPAIDYSLAGMIGHWMEPVLRPIGFNWQIGVALVPGMAAREVAVGALGTVYAVSGDDVGTLGSVLASHWSLATALSLLAWYVFAPQCASTLAVVKRETNSWRWPIIMFGYMLTLAYLASFITYNVARHFGG